MSLKPSSRLRLVALAAFCLGSAGAFAAGKAHVHGIATLNVSLSDTEVEVALDSPADNLVGFEHQPHTAEQRKAVVQAVQQLKDAGSLIRFAPDGGCSLEEADIDNPFDMDDDHDHDGHDHDNDKHDHEDHDHDKHDHDEHDHGDHDKHDHDDHDHDHDHGEGVHSDFEVEYAFHCKNATAIQRIDLQGLFTHFPRFQTVKVNWVGSHGQSAARATSAEPVVQLKK